MGGRALPQAHVDQRAYNEPDDAPAVSCRLWIRSQDGRDGLGILVHSVRHPRYSSAHRSVGAVLGDIDEAERAEAVLQMLRRDDDVPAEHVLDNGGEVHRRRAARTVQLSGAVPAGAVPGAGPDVHAAVPGVPDNIVLRVLVLRGSGGFDGEIPSEHGDVQQRGHTPDDVPLRHVLLGIFAAGVLPGPAVLPSADACQRMHKGGKSRNGVPVVVSRGAHSVRYRILSDRMEASEDQEDLNS